MSKRAPKGPTPKPLPHGGKPPRRKASTPKKRGPKEERLYMPDIEAALNTLLKPAKRLGKAMTKLRDNSKL